MAIVGAAAYPAGMQEEGFAPSDAEIRRVLELARAGIARYGFGEELQPEDLAAVGATLGGRTTLGCEASVTCSNGYSASGPAGHCAALRQRDRRRTCTPTSATSTTSCGRARGAPCGQGGRRRSPAKRWTPPCTGWMVTLIYASLRSWPRHLPVRLPDLARMAAAVSPR
jgi:hypothetical protein